ncbi:MAG: electron transporter RnfD [Gallionellales bacterium GWA2_60_142]|nr:MAG: electron transporter RnfD [Gallionellales bacterium GWA2_60_142]HCI14026.1 electron transporter RnfD [Gallionellaceae bacterium]
MSMELRASPHLHSGRDVPTIMRHVVYALLPICAFSIWQYGLSAIALITTVTLSCLAAERIANRMSGTVNTLSDWSATITGILLALTLPPAFPLWMGAVAGFAAVWLGKSLFGGLGHNPFNPALVGRAFVQAAFPTAITTWAPAFSPQRFTEFIPSTLTLPFCVPNDISAWVTANMVDGFTGATPLARWKFEQFVYPVEDMITGAAAASTGETSALLLLVCGLYLIARRFMDWRIPVAVVGSAMIMAWGFQMYDPEAFPPMHLALLSGGLMLGALFMATDMATSPVTPMGIWVYGAIIGVVTILIRYFGGLTEGVMYAILFGNAAAPLIDKYLQPKVFGARKK